MDIAVMDSSFVIGACIGITQKRGEINEEKFVLVLEDLYALEGGYITANRPSAADAVSKFNKGWQLAFPKEWRS